MDLKEISIITRHRVDSTQDMDYWRSLWFSLTMELFYFSHTRILTCHFVELFLFKPCTRKQIKSQKLIKI